MKFIANNTFFWGAIFASVGICLARVEVGYLPLASGIFLVLLILGFWRRNWVLYALLAGGMTAFGFILYHLKKPTPPPFPKGEIVAYTSVIQSDVLEKNKSQQCIAEIDKALLPNGKWIPCERRVAIYNKNSQKDICYGSVLLIKGSPSAPRPVRFPWQFDYASFLQNRGIFLQHFVDSVSLLGQTNPNPLLYYALRIRNACIKKLAIAIPNTENLGVAIALILGNSSYLSNDSSTLFGNAGALHALAVSGAHLMILVAFLLPSTSAFNRKKSATLNLRYFLTFVLIWVYALITGWSGSVLRAAIMGSVMILGNAFRRSVPLSNSLGISALLLIAINPNFLFEVGFQLSYLAVLGIAFFKPELDKLLPSPKAYFRHLRDISTLALAANLGTLVLSAYYFNKIPTYFLLANLFVIPLTEWALISGLAGVVMSFLPFPTPSNLLLRFTSLAIQLNSWLLEQINKLPFVVIAEVDVSLWDVVLVYLVLACLILVFEFRKIIFLYTGIFIGIVVSILIFLEQQKTINAGKTAILYYRGSLQEVPNALLAKKTFDPTSYFNQHPPKPMEIAENVYLYRWGKTSLLKITGYSAWKKLKFAKNPAPTYVLFQGFVPFYWDKKPWLSNAQLLYAGKEDAYFRSFQEAAKKLSKKVTILSSPMTLP